MKIERIISDKGTVKLGELELGALYRDRNDVTSAYVVIADAAGKRFGLCLDRLVFGDISGIPNALVIPMEQVGALKVRRLLEGARMRATAEQLLEWTWGLIANAGGGDWDKETAAWKGCAERWRNSYHAWVEEQKVGAKNCRKSKPVRA